MSETTFLELVEGVGPESDFVVDPKSGLEVPNPKAGEPAELKAIGFQIPLPTQVGDDIVYTTSKVEVGPADAIDPENPVASRIVPGTRIVETNAPAVVNALLETGHYQLCDPPGTRSSGPTKAQLEGHATTLGLDVAGLKKAEIQAAIDSHVPAPPVEVAPAQEGGDPAAPATTTGGSPS
jgi:hypothetical protein